MLDLHSCSIDGKLCEPELREWLLSSADISLKRVDGLLELLDDNDVDTVKDLARLATMTCFDTILKPVTASKVREALASREGSTALPVRDLPAERGTRLDEGASPPATPTREPARGRATQAGHPAQWFRGRGTASRALCTAGRG